jgi:hypothetical protein
VALGARVGHHEQGDLLARRALLLGELAIVLGLARVPGAIELQLHHDEQVRRADEDVGTTVRRVVSIPHEDAGLVMHVLRARGHLRGLRPVLLRRHPRVGLVVGIELGGHDRAQGRPHEPGRTQLGVGTQRRSEPLRPRHLFPLPAHQRKHVHR